MKLSSVVIAVLGVTCSALEETNQVRALKGGKAGGFKVRALKGGKAGGDKGGNSAGGKKGKSAKGTASPTVSLAPTLLKNSKAKSSEPEFVCPFEGDEAESTDDYYYGKSSKGKRRMLKGGKSGSKSKGKSSESPFFLDAFPDGPGSSILIVPAEDPTMCSQPAELEAGGAVIMAECGFSEAEAFKVDRYGRLHSSKWSLCVQGDGGDLVLGPCDSCSALFQYDEEESTISPMEDTGVVFTADNGAMNLQPLASRRLAKNGGKQLILFFFQIFVILLFVPGAPTVSPAPTGSLAPV